MSIRRLMAICVCGVFAGMVGCVEADGDEEVDEAEQTAMALSVDFQGDTDVAGMRYSIFECGADTPLFVEQKDLEDMVLPGMIPHFENEPFDERSSHLFADYFRVVDAGCYDVVAEPLDADGDRSADCRKARADEVRVVDSKTTEVLLVSQCDGPERGAIDAVAALNHPPQIEAVNFDPSKFMACPAKLTVCATASDPDGDPISFEWKQLEGPALDKGPVVVDESAADGSTTQCVEMTFQNRGAGYLFELTVFDWFYDDGEPITAEEWFLRHDYGEVASRARLEIPVYVGCETVDRPQKYDRKKNKHKKKGGQWGPGPRY